MSYLMFDNLMREMRWLFAMSRHVNMPQYYRDRAIRLGQHLLAHREVTVSPPQYNKKGECIRSALFIYTPTELH